MLHPIGSQPPAVYWRRRLALLTALLVMVLLTVWELRPGGGDKTAASPAARSTLPQHTSTQQTGTPQTTSKSAASAPSTSPITTPATTNVTHTAAVSVAGPPRCTPAQVKIASAVDKPSYSVGAQPLVMIQVTNTGTKPCVQDLADSQIELRIYNGASRVWGSHDCTIQPGVADRTLAVGQPLRVSIVWSGLSSQPKCAGTRQRVGAGIYTLYGLLAGHQGTAAQFSIT